MYWGYVKWYLVFAVVIAILCLTCIKVFLGISMCVYRTHGRQVRKICNYTFAGLLRHVPAVLDSVPLDLIRKFARKSRRFIDVYRAGTTGRLAGKNKGSYVAVCFNIKNRNPNLYN
jgi:hypothetical protein